jgi:hypothetical protein
MPQAQSLHIASNVFLAALGKPLPDLKSCETDAVELGKAAADRGFTPNVLTRTQAVFDKVDAAFTAAAKQVHAGDYFVVTFSSHGLVSEDLTTNAWCLPDRVVKRHGLKPSVDDWLSRFDPGVRIVVFANCCASGDVLAGVPAALEQQKAAFNALVKSDLRRGAGLPSDSRFTRVFESASDFVRKLFVAPSVRADVITISACGIGQVASDGQDPQLPTPFIERVLGVLKEDKYKDFDDFLGLVNTPPVPNQTPELNRTPSGVKNAFDKIGPLRPLADPIASAQPPAGPAQPPAGPDNAAEAA